MIASLLASIGVASDIPVSSLANDVDGSLITWDTSGVATTVAPSTDGFQLQTHGAGAEPTWVARDPQPNLLLNGSFRIAARGAGPFTAATVPVNSDATYLFDRWVLLSDGNDIVDVARGANPGTADSQYYLDSTWQTANKQIAYFEILEAADSAQLGGHTVSLSFEAAYSNRTSLDTLRVGILEWAGTEDSPTKDCIGTWAGGGTNPTLATNWSFANTPADLTLTGSWQQFTDAGVSISGTVKNVGVLIWVDNTTISAGEQLFLAKVKLERGSTVTEYYDRPYGVEALACQRFFESFAYDASFSPVSFGMNIANNSGIGGFIFKVTKRITPTVVDSAATDFLVSQNTGSGLTLSAFTMGQISKAASRLTYTTTGTALVQGDCTDIIAANTSATLFIDAEFNT